MSLLALGLNHHTAPVDVRERLAIGADRLPIALQELAGHPAINEAAIVSTCNRTEFYCGLEHTDSTPLLSWLNDTLAVDAEQVRPFLFEQWDRDAAAHLMRVCAGLDSLILGEPQILGQVKDAYRDANDVGTVGSRLSTLFESAFSVAKQVRSETDIGAHPVSIAFAAVTLSRRIFADFSRHSALLIGAGDTVQLAARHLKSNGIGQLLIANRTVQRAATLADELGAQALSLGDIPNVLHQADIIITATAAPLPILGKGAVEAALKARRYRPMLIVDIAVPRDVEEQVGKLDNVFLYTVDHLKDVIEENRRSRELAAEQAEDIVEREADQFMTRLRVMEAGSLIRDYRDSVEKIRQQLLERAHRQLRAGTPPEQVIEQLSHQLGNRLMHAPTTALRDAAANNHDIAPLSEALLGAQSRKRSR